MNKKVFAIFGFILVYLSYIPLGLWIVETPGFNDFYDSFGLSNSVLGYYITENAFDLAFIGLLTIGLCILLINRFKYTKEDHFQLTKRTKLVAISTVAIAIIGMIVEVFFNGSNHSIHTYMGEFLKQLLWVGLVEELIFRGFIFIKLLKLKNPKFKLIHIVLVSAFLFSIIHLPGFFLYNSNYDFLSILGRLLFPFLIGILYAYLLYMTKDIVSLVFIHATSNMISNYTGISGTILYLIFWFGLIYYTYQSYKLYKQKPNRQDE